MSRYRRLRTCRSISDEGMLALNEAMERLANEMPRLADVVECRFFGGYGEEDTARALGVSLRTVQRDWLKARAWLFRELGGAVRLAIIRLVRDATTTEPPLCRSIWVTWAVLKGTAGVALAGPVVIAGQHSRETLHEHSCATGEVGCLLHGAAGPACVCGCFLYTAATANHYTDEQSQHQRPHSVAIQMPS